MASDLTERRSTVVLLHPIGLDGSSFRFVGDELLGRAVAHDLLWHGGRPRPAETPTLESMADDVAALTEGRLDVVGVSLGGAVAQYLALRHPERVHSLLLAASTASDADPARQEEFDRRADDVLEHGMDGVADWAVDRWFTPEVREDATHPAVRYVRDRLHRDDPRSFAASWRALGSNAALPRFGEITAPMTVLHPRDDLAPLAVKERMRDALPCSRLVVTDGPHMVHLETPETFTAAALDHLAWADTRAPVSG